MSAYVLDVLVVCRANVDGVGSDGSLASKLPSVIDFTLDKEIQKAAAIVGSFKNAAEGQELPRRLLEMAKGVVFFTIVKAGFIFSGRYGTGLIVARLPEGKWSSPSAVQMSGAGWGLQIGADVTTVMLILTSDSAVDVFTTKGQVSVGAELCVSAGLMGRSIEADMSASTQGAAHAFSYAQSKGLFVGACLEASGIAARTDVNRSFYGEDIPVKSLLRGEHPPCKGAEVLYSALDELMNSGEDAKEAMQKATGKGEKEDVTSGKQDVDKEDTKQQGKGFDKSKAKDSKDFADKPVKDADFKKESGFDQKKESEGFFGNNKEVDAKPEKPRKPSKQRDSDLSKDKDAGFDQSTELQGFFDAGTAKDFAEAPQEGRDMEVGKLGALEKKEANFKGKSGSEPLKERSFEQGKKSDFKKKEGGADLDKENQKETTSLLNQIKPIPATSEVSKAALDSTGEVPVTSGSVKDTFVDENGNVAPLEGPAVGAGVDKPSFADVV
jgi:lipid-binding SYLF domain-containing protein